MNNTQIEAIVPFLDRFEAKEFSAGTWNSEPGAMPWFTLDDAVEEFLQALQDNGWIASSFNWQKWQETAMKYIEMPSSIEQADVKTIQKLLNTHVRKERFCEGHLAAMFENGHIQALLRRLKAIRSEAPLDRSQLIEAIRDILGPSVKEEMSLTGSLIFTSGDPGEVVVRLHGIKVSVEMFAVVWEQVHLPVVHPKPCGTFYWKMIPASQLTSCLQVLIDSVRQARLAKYRKCQFCGEMIPPEWQHNKNTCMSCAENHLGVVH